MTTPPAVGVALAALLLVLAFALRPRPVTRPVAGAHPARPCSSGSSGPDEIQAHDPSMNQVEADGDDSARIHHLLRRATRLGRGERPIGPGEIATWVDDVSRSVGRGTTVSRALVEVVPDPPRLRALTSPMRLALARGATVRGACAHLSADGGSRRPTAGERRHLLMVESVVSTTAAVGGSVTLPLDRVAAALRRSAADLLERNAQAAQARLSATVLTLVPLALLVLLVIADDDVRRVVVRPLGAALVAAGVALNGLGAWWMRRIISGGTT